MSFKRKISNTICCAIFSLFIIAFTCAIGEIALRLNPRFAKEKKHREWLRSMMTYDETLGWKHVPGADVSSETPEYAVRYSINSKGLRDRERGYEKEGLFRILCPGDSFTFGWGVEAEERFTDVLENLTPGSEVINMGVQGYGIDQELLQLRGEGVKYHPDLIVIYVIPQDLTRACYSKMWDKPKPRFAVEAGTLRLTNVPVPRVDIFSFKNPTADQLRYLLARKSYLFYYLQNLLHRRYALQVRAHGDEADKEELSRAVFKEMRKTAESLDAELIIVGTLPEELQEYLRSNDIYYCPDPLSGYRGNPLDIRFTELGHPNARGHRLIAEGIRAFMTGNGLVPQMHPHEKASQ